MRHAHGRPGRRGPRLASWRTSSARSTRARRAPGSWCSTTTGGRWRGTSSSTSRSCPSAGWVEHNPLEIWERTQTGHRPALTRAGISSLRPGRRRDHQPARDHGRVGPPHRPPLPQRHRLAGHPHRPPSPAPWTPTAAATSSASAPGCRRRTYFSAGKMQWMLENVDGLRAAAERGDAVFGTTDTWVIWNLTGGTEGGRPRHRRDEREPHDAHGPRRPSTGTTSCSTSSASRARCCPTIHPSSRRRGVRRHGRAARRQRGPDHRRPRRPAGGHRRSGVLRAGRGEEHLRHRQLPAAQHRRPSSSAPRTAC